MTNGFTRFSQKALETFPETIDRSCTSPCPFIYTEQLASSQDDDAFPHMNQLFKVFL